MARDSIQLSSVRLTLTMWPTQATLDRTRSGLPNLVLLLGIGVSILTGETLRMRQTAQRSAQGEAHANFNLALGRDTDGIWEWHVPSGASTRGADLLRHLGYDPDTIEPQMSAWLALVEPEGRERGSKQASALHLQGARRSTRPSIAFVRRMGSGMM